MPVFLKLPVTAHSLQNLTNSVEPLTKIILIRSHLSPTLEPLVDGNDRQDFEFSVF